MAETFGPFDGVPWSQGQWFDFASTWAQSAVIGSPATATTTGELALTANGLTLSLGTGRAWVRGAGYKNDAAKAITVPANTNASLSRRDRVVLRRDLAAKTVTAILLQGTPAATPAAPSLTQVDAGVWDVPLFSFLVPPSSGTVISGIVDERVWSADLTVNRLRVTSTGDASDTSTNHGFQVGPDSGQNIIFDGNEMIVRNNGVRSGFGLNAATVTVPAPTGNGQAAQYQSTAWTDWGVLSGWSKTNGWSRYRILNGVFYWTASLIRASWAAGQSIASLSVANAPAQTFIVFGTWDKDSYDIYIGDDGLIQVARAGTGGLVIGGSWPIG